MTEVTPPAERERGGGEHSGLLADEEPGPARRLDGRLFDGGDRCVEFLDGGCGDGDDVGVAEDAVSSRIGVQISKNDRWMPADSSTGDRNPG